MSEPPLREIFGNFLVEYGNKYKEWHEQFKDLSWGIKDNVYKYRVQYQTLNIASYLVDEALYR